MLAGACQHGGQIDSLIHAQLTATLLVVRKAGFLAPENILTPLGIVQVKFQNTVLTQFVFHKQSVGQFLKFALPGTFTAQKQVLGQLLRNGGTAKLGLAGHAVGIQSLCNGVHIKARVEVEPSILAGNHSLLQVGANGIQRHKGVLDLHCRVGIPERLHVAAHFGLGVLQVFYAFVQVVTVNKSLVENNRSNNAEHRRIKDQGQQHHAEQKIDETVKTVENLKGKISPDFFY